MRDILIRARSDKPFRHWQLLLEDPEAAKKILTGFQALRKNIICEQWRETQLRIIHRAIYGFNLPNPTNDPSRITACPKCGLEQLDLWHGLWLCPKIQDYWDLIVQWINTHWKSVVSKSPEALIFHFIRPPDEVTGETEPWVPGIYHTIFLLVKRCILKRWLEAQPPDLNMLLTHLKSAMTLDKIYSERHV